MEIGKGCRVSQTVLQGSIEREKRSQVVETFRVHLAVGFLAWGLARPKTIGGGVSTFEKPVVLMIALIN